MEKRPFEDFFHLHGNVVDVAAFDGNAPVHQRPHPIIVPRRYGYRQPGHGSS
jgi:hypothetical protein